jgi:hypothetical protein
MYHIHDTCPVIYEKTIAKLTKQLKKDKTDYTLLEVGQNIEHSRICSDINYTGRMRYHYDGHTRKLKGCLTCPYQREGRKNSTKTTIITLTGGK